MEYDYGSILKGCQSADLIISKYFTLTRFYVKIKKIW